ncbi:hypothetical protein BKA65DRAFT_102621 [Rhexocercosporidium sp. MPI-PUGE-AT-0058]|nr:hypothetical protein BKA65DRAFT_102621 [Rhexocercosporidium sp. MPI-PUGE-AT-0058]
MCCTNYPLHTTVFLVAIALRMCAPQCWPAEYPCVDGKEAKAHDEIHRVPYTLSDSRHAFTYLMGTIGQSIYCTGCSFNVASHLPTAPPFLMGEISHQSTPDILITHPITEKEFAEMDQVSARVGDGNHSLLPAF